MADVKQLSIPPDFYQIIDQLDIYSDTQETHFKIDNDKLVVLNISDLYQWLARKSEKKRRQVLLAAKFLETQQTKDGQYLSTIRSRNTSASQI